VTLLEVEDAHTYYGESHILEGVSLEVGEGEVVALVGRNGVGKTTTLRTISCWWTNRARDSRRSSSSGSPRL